VLSQLQAPAVRLGAAVQVSSTKLETYTRLKGNFKEGVHRRGRILYLTGSLPCSPVVGVLENKLVTLEDPLLLAFIYTIYICTCSFEAVIA
jgi:hypothetical protein